jgi:hypothetical protein
MSEMDLFARVNDACYGIPDKFHQLLSHLWTEKYEKIKLCEYIAAPSRFCHRCR